MVAMSAYGLLWLDYLATYKLSSHFCKLSLLGYILIMPYLQTQINKFQIYSNVQSLLSNKFSFSLCLVYL